MSMRILIMMIFFGFIGVLNDIYNLWFRGRSAKKANYDCNKCSVWDCPYHECKKHM